MLLQKIKRGYETILDRIETRMDERIRIGTFGTMITNNEATQGYYLVKWITEPYTVHENTVMKGVEPQHTTFSREIICDAMFWNPVPNVTDWYTPISKEEGLVMIRLKDMLITGVTMKKISDKNMILNECNKKKEASQEAMNIDDDNVWKIIEETYRRDNFDKEFAIGLMFE